MNTDGYIWIHWIQMDKLDSDGYRWIQMDTLNTDGVKYKFKI